MANLTTALGNALTGLNASQAGIDLLSRNVSNANTPGYTRKVLPRENRMLAGEGAGVRTLPAQREVDLQLQKQLYTQRAMANHATVRLDYLQRVDEMFGRPEDDASVAAQVKSLTLAFQSLSNAPELSANRQKVLDTATLLANDLNNMSDTVQAMRLQAEQALADTVAEVNDCLNNIHRLNGSVARATVGGLSSADLEDERDLYMKKLSDSMGVRFVTGDNNRISIFTESGRSLLDGGVNELIFDPASTVSAFSSIDNGLVGQIILSGTNEDLLTRNEIRSGTMAGLIEMRDQVLPRVQRQLDDLAHGLATSLSAEYHATAANGAAATVDFTNIGRTGDAVVIDYVDGAGAVQQLVLTAGTDFAIGADDDATMANFEAAVNGSAFGLSAAVGPSGSLQTGLTAPAGGRITSVRSYTEVGMGMQLFVDRSDDGPLYADLKAGNFSSIPGGDQRTGFAGRIAVNPALLANNTALVSYKSRMPGATDLTSPIVADVGTDHRAVDMFQRLSARSFVFDGNHGISGNGGVYHGTIEAFASNIVGFQAASVADAETRSGYETRYQAAIEVRFDGATGVNVDDELAQMMLVQNAYNASARLIQTITAMMDELLSLAR